MPTHDHGSRAKRGARSTFAAEVARTHGAAGRVLQPRPVLPPALRTPAALRGLQRSLGNRAVGRALSAASRAPTAERLRIQRYQEGAVSRSDAVAAHAMVARLNGPMSTMICHAVLVTTDGRMFKAHSQGFETSAGHAERYVVKSLCEAVDVPFTADQPAQIRQQLAQKGIRVRHLYVDFQPCGECQTWLTQLLENTTPVYYMEDFPYRDQSREEFRKTYQKFQTKLFTKKKEESLQDASETAGAVNKELATAWGQHLNKAVLALARPALSGLGQIAYKAKANETLIGNLIAYQQGALIRQALEALVPRMGNNLDRYLAEVNVVHNPGGTIRVTKVAAEVLRWLIANTPHLNNYRQDYAIP